MNSETTSKSKTVSFRSNHEPSRQPTPSSPLLAGALVDNRYRLLRQLGSGGMGEVWVARHELLDREVAIKFLRFDVGLGSDALLDEAKLLASLKHPAIVDVSDCGLWEREVPYLVMELIEGENLSDWLVRMGPRPAREAVELLVPVARGLHVVHERGVIHRDVKPDNILRTKGPSSPIKLIDFGISRRATGASSVSTFSGTPHYMAPEQIRGERGDRRVDVWSLGATLYELLAGIPPFDGADVSSILALALAGVVPYPRKCAGLDGSLWRIVMQCLRIEPEQRFATTDALADALELWLSARVKPNPITQSRPSVPNEGGESLSTPRSGETAPTALDQLIKTKLSSR